jgi:hypothetical protein
MHTSVRSPFRQKRTAVPGRTGWIWRTWNGRESSGAQTNHRSAQAPGRSQRFQDQRGLIACLMIRATCSSRHAEPQRVRSDWRFTAAAIPRIVRPLWRR